MNSDLPNAAHEVPGLNASMPSNLDLYYGGSWHRPAHARYSVIRNPATGGKICDVAQGSTADVESAITAAQAGFLAWKAIRPLERAKSIRAFAQRLRENAKELALIDAATGGNPWRDLVMDVEIAASQLDFFAGLVTEMKGHSVPMGPGDFSFSVREPLGIVARIIPFNHPLMFSAGKAAAPLAAGNSLIIKPPEQAPVSALRLAELSEGLFPAGVFNVIPGGKEVGAELASDPRVSAVAVIGSVATGIAVGRAAAETVKPVLLELGGKNALIAYPDVDPATVAAAVVAGMNFSWCGQSCGSTSRAFIHADIYDEVNRLLIDHCQALVPGIPTDPATTMGCIISRAQYDSIRQYIELGKQEGARLLCGGKPPTDPRLQGGFFLEPTVFVDVKQHMRIASEEIFGPVLSVLKWEDEGAMLQDVNALPVGLTCSIWTHDLRHAQHCIANVEAGYVWVNETSKHFLGTPFGGHKQSGLGREECLEELLSFSKEKNVYLKAVPSHRTA
ncbi:aldehyde dehydrogenase [Achromobacter xylosoxidans]|jgi:betaine-aldehyde dehydrogenase|uniref:Aldehyde dehydrogenase n=2 Tax=Achromobacter TaxID=222 RepID=A0A1R1K025_ALCXX|nr:MULTISPECIES: aldehyde dehydrogenase family protein [Achromobacter]OFS37303.1 aldehyde dehydrogenase [Achromobacter xylosoxidans]OMG92743.1 aldehyde dehydrogenase [Achromobacter xylosoxidans]CAB3630102.1 2-formylbenzoate dehydrogenase [Achromobacter insuavis]CAB3833208.1 2-formylbenzoate dehydrogenase [Achromobacter deleyi]CUI72909.1 Betaine aldehyde dehydrogenase [Achromobacter xylosoxidans]